MSETLKTFATSLRGKVRKASPLSYAPFGFGVYSFAVTLPDGRVARVSIESDQSAENRIANEARIARGDLYWWEKD